MENKHHERYQLLQARSAEDAVMVFALSLGIM